MEEKYYVVSESELENLKNQAFKEIIAQFTGSGPGNDLSKAKKACRSRPVQEGVSPDKKSIAAVWLQINE